MSNLLSVIVPVTKIHGQTEHLEKWIPLALENDIQVVIVHDLQDDLSKKEIAKLSQDFANQNLILIEKYFGSPGFARNAGLEAAKGDYIAFWDCDDDPDVHKALELAQKCFTHDVEIGIGSFKQISQKSTGGSTKVVTSNNLTNVALNPGIWRMVFNRSKLNHHKFTSLKMGEDQIFLLEINIGNSRILYSDDVVYTYYFGGIGNTTSDKSKVSELRNSINYIFSQLNNFMDQDLTFIIAVKQSITLLKRGLYRYKIFGLFMILKLFSTSPSKTFKAGKKVLNGKFII